MNRMGISGTNNVPLGARRRGMPDAFVPPPPTDDLPPPPPSIPPPPAPADSSFAIPPPPPPSDYHEASLSSADKERGRAESRNADGARKRKRKNRWAAAEDNHVANLINLPTSISGSMTPEQIEAYVLNLRIEEISQKLRINDVVPKDGERSPSPPPQYDGNGKRVNTREYRYRKKLEDERHKLIEKAMKTIPDFKPPADYRRPLKTQEKVFVPVNDYPEINFIGQLLGPRGNTLRKMEAESGAKIAIRGKGSVKEGKGRSDAAYQSNLEEDLHCLIIADTEEKVQLAIKLVNKVIQTAASIPEGENELKRNQLRELASLNGTLRDDENQTCQNCGDVGHRKYECPLLRNYTANIICRICGNAGHFARDCRERPPVGEFPRFNNNGGGYNNGKNETDQEYERLMLELTGNESANGTGTRAAIEDGGFSQSRSRSDYPSRPLPPPSSQPMPPRSSAPPPWARR
ncbi:uncharacterized protein V2V93DRAFT_357987 [Kockiozyma suomiensis]|uniref:uncharacterized protein n=1 Tax=Kockiozyma suomiensis TaxID=1337062 RepID=UPI0033436D62